MAGSQLEIGSRSSVALIQAAGRLGSLIADSLSQEGISVQELSPSGISSLELTPSVRVAIVAVALTDAEREQLKRWMDKGGAVILLNADLWPTASLEGWFGVQPTGEETDGGYFWPSSPDFSFPALPGDSPIQILGKRRVYRRSPLTQTLAEGSINPSAATCFDAIRDGFADDEWFWCGTTLITFRRGRCIVSTFEIPTIGPFAPTTAAGGDFNGDSFRDDLIVAREDFYAVAIAGVFTHTGVLQQKIKHIMCYPRADSPVWGINAFLGDGSIFQTSFDGGRTFGPAQPFDPAGVSSSGVPTDFGYSFEYIDEGGGVARTGLNVWSRGAFFSYQNGNWSGFPFLPDLGPKYLSANILWPTLGYSGDQNRTGIRDLLTLLVHANVYARDRVSGGFNYPLQFQRLYSVRKQPLVVRNGRAVAFLYDFESTVRQLQQGDDISDAVFEQLIYFSELGEAVAFTPIINAFKNFIDYANLDLPQADLHERVLRQAIVSLIEAPLPRIWYLPNGYRSVASLSHDIETAAPGQRAAVRQATMEIARMSADRQRRDTNFALMTSGDAGLLSAEDIRELERLGHEVTVHFDSFGSTDFTPANFQSQSNTLRQYGVTRIPGTRSHGLAWLKDYVPLAVQSQPETVYDSTFGGGPGYSHCGSIFPYRIYGLDGSTYSTFFEISHGLMDIADSDFFFKGLVPEGRLTLSLTDLFERARAMARLNNESLYGFFDALMHPVVVAGLVPPIPTFFDLLQQYAEFLRQENIPSLPMAEMVDWWKKRSGLQVLGVTWDGNSRLRFTLGSQEVVENVTLVLPQNFQGRQLTSITDGTAKVRFKIEQLDGQNQAMLVIPAVSNELKLEAVYK